MINEKQIKRNQKLTNYCFSEKKRFFFLKTVYAIQITICYFSMTKIKKTHFNEENQQQQKLNKFIFILLLFSINCTYFHCHI